MASQGDAPGGQPGAGKVPPRPAGKTPARPRPMGQPGGPYRPARPAPRASARQLARRRQRNIYIVTASSSLVAVLIAVVVVVAVVSGGGGARAKKGGSSALSSKGPATYTAKAASNPLAGTSPVPLALLEKVEGVPTRALVSEARAHLSGAGAPPALRGTNPMVSSGGKPEILFVSAEWCPFCAAERWVLVMALSKFGNFGPLRSTASAADDGDTPTFSFYGAKYSSPYLAFVPVEEQDRAGQPLQALTPAEKALFAKYDSPPYVSSGSASDIPFLLLAGKYLDVGAQFSPVPIDGLPFAKAVQYITSGTDATSREAEAAAGYLVREICTLTNNRPGSACSES